MECTVNREAEIKRQIQGRLSILIGTMLLISATQLLGRDQSPAAGRSDLPSQAPGHLLMISIPDRKLAIVEEGRAVKIYPVAVGACVTPSPTGTLRIVNKVVGPTYYHKGKVIRPGKSNPLGDRWMGLSEKGYGIHGTNVPNSIGKAASHGCIRMGRHDVEELFELARVGDAVEIHGERDARVAAIFGGVTLAQAAVTQGEAGGGE